MSTVKATHVDRVPHVRSLHGRKEPRVNVNGAKFDKPLVP